MSITKAYDGYYNMFKVDRVEFASRKDVPFIQGNEKPDCVSIIAKHYHCPSCINDMDYKLAVVCQHRPTIGHAIIELPAGKIDPGETPIEAGRRELKEETGLTMLTRVAEQRGRAFPSVGITDESHVIVSCLCTGELSTEYLGKNEKIIPRLLSTEELLKLLDGDVAIDAKLLSFIYGLKYLT